MYLENIFTSPDISRSLPTEANIFTKNDQFLKNLMRKSEKNPKILNLVKPPNMKLLDHLSKISESLDDIERQLENFLETKKRQVFPRFYFLSNDELLEILA